MKVNVIPGLLVLMISALLAFLFYTISDAEEQMRNALVMSGFLAIGVCLVGGVGISLKEKSRSTNMIAVSCFFLVIFIIEHICFSLWGTNLVWLIVFSGILILSYLLLIYGIIKE